MRVLVTNDDGVEAPGLRALAGALHAEGHEVMVVAPSGDWSGSGGAIGRLHRSGPIPWTETTWSELPGVSVHALDLPPAAAVYAGCLGAFGPRPDVVASGVNPGLNAGHLVLHSGTVGAALSAAVLGLPAVATSLAWGEEQHWASATGAAVAALDWLVDQPGPTVLSLNVPNVVPGELKGARAATLAGFDERWQARTAPGELHLEFEGHDHEPAPDSDVAAVRAGYVAVSVLAGITTRDQLPDQAARAVAAARAP